MSVDEPIRVMIVDDHLMVRDGLKVFLSVYDDLLVVAEAADGQAAVDLCDQARPDVILMDILMPGMDGPAATQLIRARFPHIQVIALTSFAEGDLVQRALQSGAIAYLLQQGIDTVFMISFIFFGLAIRAIPPSRRISAGTRSSAITATAPASSAIFA